jgi:hypothetical protein
MSEQYRDYLTQVEANRREKVTCKTARWPPTTFLRTCLLHLYLGPRHKPPCRYPMYVCMYPNTVPGRGRLGRRRAGGGCRFSGRRRRCGGRGRDTSLLLTQNIELEKTGNQSAYRRNKQLFIFHTPAENEKNQLNTTDPDLPFVVNPDQNPGF